MFVKTMCMVGVCNSEHQELGHIEECLAGLY
jgi:hypothetical protein